MKLLSGPIGPSRAALVALLVVGAVYAVTLSLLPVKGLWVVDNADKFLQMRAIAASGYRDYSIPWPGTTIDPDFKYRPIPDPFSYVSHGKMFAFYPPFFATVSSFFFRAFGFRGLCLLPLASSLIALAGIAAIAGSLSRDHAAGPVAIMLAGLCTPMWFYSVVFWEHTAAVCFSIWAVVFCLRFVGTSCRRDLVTGSILAALSVYFRDELYLFCAILLACMVWWQQKRSARTAAVAGAAMVLTFIPLWLFQRVTIGHPLGHHLGGLLASESGMTDHLKSRLAALYNMFVASTPRHWLSVVASGPLLVLLVFCPRISREKFGVGLPVVSLAAAGCSAVSLVGYFTSHAPIDYMIESCNSFLTVAPVLILGFLRMRGPDGDDTGATAARRVWLIAVAYSAAYGVLAPELGTSGMHWGNRFLLGVYPLFGVLAAINLVKWARAVRGVRSWKWAAVALVVAVSFAAQLYSISLLQKKEDFSQRLNQAIHDRPEKVIITRVQWVPLDLYSEFSDRMIFLASTKQDFEGLVQRLAGAGYVSALLIAQLPEAQAKGAVLTVDDNGLNFFTLRFFPLQIGQR